MKIIEFKTKAQVQQKPREDFTVYSYCEFMLFLPVVFIGFIYAKASLYFRTGKSIGETF